VASAHLTRAKNIFQLRTRAAVTVLDVMAAGVAASGVRIVLTGADLRQAEVVDLDDEGLFLLALAGYRRHLLTSVTTFVLALLICLFLRRQAIDDDELIKAKSPKHRRRSKENYQHVNGSSGETTSDVGEPALISTYIPVAEPSTADRALNGRKHVAGEVVHGQGQQQSRVPMDNNNAKSDAKSGGGDQTDGSAAATVGRAAKEVLFNTKNAMISSFASVIETTKELSLGGEERQRTTATPQTHPGEHRPPSLGSSATSSRESSAEPGDLPPHSLPRRVRAPPLASSSTSRSGGSHSSSAEGKMVTINPCQVRAKHFGHFVWTTT